MHITSPSLIHTVLHLGLSDLTDPRNLSVSPQLPHSHTIINCMDILILTRRTDHDQVNFKYLNLVCAVCLPHLIPSFPPSTLMGGDA